MKKQSAALQRRQEKLKTDGRQNKRGLPVAPEIREKLIRLYTVEKLPMSIIKARFSTLGMLRIRSILQEAGANLSERRERPEGIGIF